MKKNVQIFRKVQYKNIKKYPSWQIKDLLILNALKEYRI